MISYIDSQKELLDILEENCSLPEIPPVFDWQKTSDAEIRIYNNILNKNKKL